MYNLKKRLKTVFTICILATITLLTGCKTQANNSSKQQEYITKTTFKLNTVVTVTIYDKQEEYLLEESMKLCDYYEQLFSRTSEKSELYQFNHGLLDTDSSKKNSAVLNKELAQLIQSGIHYGDVSQGTFDITVAPLATLWNFTAKEPKVPSKDDIKALLPHVNYKDINVSDDTVTLADETMGIDLGAIAKGYIADRIKDYLISEGVKSAMINLGGNVLCVGEKVNGSPFRVGIQKPFADRNEIIAVMELKDKSVVSSGIYERFFVEDGVSYHHILNPETGYPYDNNLVSVTIISNLSVDGDGLSTSCFALGLEKGLELINSLEDVQAIFITSDYELHYSDGFFDAINVIEQ